MAGTTKLYGNGLSGVVQGNSGTYVAASDGTFTVNNGDIPAMLLLGMTYLRQASQSYNAPIAPLLATTGKFIASAALSVGTLSIANQPDVMRPAQVVMGAGTTAITAGTVSVTYTANDGLARTDVLSAVMAASATVTSYLTAGVCHVSSAVVSTITGGASPYIIVSTTATLSMPVDPNAKDFSVTKETIDSGDETVGALLTAVLGSITPTTAPNNTHTYSFAYAYLAPNV